MFVKFGILLAVCFVVGAIIFAVIAKIRGGLAVRMYVLLYTTGMISLCTGIVWGQADLDLVISSVAFGIATPLALVVLFFVSRWGVGKIQLPVSQFATATSQLADVARNQQTASNEVSTSIAEMTNSAEFAVKNATEISSVSDQSVETGNSGLAYVSQVGELLEQITRTRDALELIEDISDQSNLLAVNAGIEASKAGDHGRGFSVVAQEMRRLSTDTKRATKKIQAVLGGVSQGFESARMAEGVLKKLTEVLDESSDRTRQIKGSIQQQAAAIAQVDGAMQGISTIADQIKNSVDMLNSSSKEINIFVNGKKA
jgi:methyl-accepting chemotaxis protein